MALELPALAELSTDRIVALRAELAQRVEELLPELDVREGVLRDLVLHLHAMFLAASETLLERVDRSNSLADLAANPQTADPEVVDAVAAAYGLARLPGDRATGTLRLDCPTATPFVLPRGFPFTTALGVLVETLVVHPIRSNSAELAGPDDRLLEVQADGAYAAEIPVVAVVAGAAGRLDQGTVLTPASPLPTVRQAVATGDFSGGADTETNAALLARIQQATASQHWGTRQTLPGFLAASGVPVFDHYAAASGDPAQTRALRGPLGLALAGKVDLYVRTALAPQRRELTVTATPDLSQGLWRAAVEAPGCYEVRGVAAADGAALVLDRVDVDYLPSTTPDVRSRAEAAYSPLQRVYASIRDPLRTPTSIADTREVRLEVAGLPDLDTLQTYVQSDAGPLGVDVLVRAPVPCFVQALVEVWGASAVDGTWTGRVQTAIHTLPMGQRLSTARVAAALQGALPAGAGLGRVDLTGLLLLPSGQRRRVSAALTGGLDVRPALEPGVTAHTVAFFCEHVAFVLLA